MSFGRSAAFIGARVPNARAMTWGSAGTLFVGSAGEGSVYAVKLPSSGTKGEGVVSKIASGLREPAGVAFRDGALYVSAISRIVRIDDGQKLKAGQFVDVEILHADEHDLIGRLAARTN